MRAALKTTGFIVAVILVLCIKIYETPIFSHIYSVIHPATDLAQEGTENLFNYSVKQTKHYSKKLFENSVPRVKDTVKSKMSSVQRSTADSESQAEPAEDILVEEKEQLDDLIKDHR
jgi:hypothetical protein